MKKLWSWIKGLFSKVGNAYDSLEEKAKPLVRIAVNVVQEIKTFNESGTADIITTIVTAAIPGTKDDIIVNATRTWLKKELPKIAIKLALVDSTINLKTTDEKLKAIISALQLSENKGEKALAFAAQLAVYLEDGKLSIEELTAAANDYYNTFVKK